VLIFLNGTEISFRKIYSVNNLQLFLVTDNLHGNTTEITQLFFFSLWLQPYILNISCWMKIVLYIHTLRMLTRL